MRLLDPMRGYVAKNGGSLHFDDLDRQIVAELARDARQSYRAIGDRVGLSASAVKRRTDRLCLNGVVVGFSAVVNPNLAGRTEAFVELYCGVRLAPEAIAQVVERHPQVIAAYTVSGEPEALLHLRTGDVAELDDVLDQIRTEVGTGRTRSSVVLGQLFQRAPSLSTEQPSRG